MIKSILLWSIKVPTLLLLTAVAWILSPIFALFIRHAEESEITGLPSQFPGKPREFLKPMFYIWQTADAPVDEWWYNDDCTAWFKTGKTQADYDSKAWLRWICRIMWLCRNAAYGFGDKLGYDSTGMEVIYQHSDDGNWNTGRPMFAFWEVVNDKGQIGWWLKAQVYFYKTRCLSINLGYKLLSDPHSKYVAMQITPFTKFKAATNTALQP